MKKLFLILVMTFALNSTVLATSTNNISKIQHLRDGSSLAAASFEITPHSEVETGSSIIITFNNATVFPQDIIDGTSSDTNAVGYNTFGYQYSENGITWNGSDSFDKIVPYTGSGKLPYYIRRMNNVQIEVFLMNLPDIYVGNSLMSVNGSTRTPYYSIPMVAYADCDGEGTVTVEIDSNGTSISNIGRNIVNNSLATATTITTEITTETTTAEIKESNVSLSNKVEVQIGNKKITVNGTKITIDAPAYIQKESNSTMIPLRAVSQGVVGNNECIKWESETKTAIILFEGNEIRFTAGSNVAYINGKSMEMDYGVKAEITDSRMFVPFRALGEALGAKVSWNEESKTAYFN